MSMKMCSLTKDKTDNVKEHHQVYHNNQSNNQICTFILVPAVHWNANLCIPKHATLKSFIGPSTATPNQQHFFCRGQCPLSSEEGGEALCPCVPSWGWAAVFEQACFEALLSPWQHCLIASTIFQLTILMHRFHVT